MSVPIFNANSILLSQNPGTLPQMNDALFNWYQPMTFTTIVKTVGPTYDVVETPTNVDFLGVWQPFGPEDLKMKPEGQRSWSWFMVHAEPGLVLNTDDVVLYLGIQYRVMAKYNYACYAYMEYHLVLDFTGSGPNP